jgi:hypothetical protein
VGPHTIFFNLALEQKKAWCQFHQHFKPAFLPIFCCQKILNPKYSFLIFGAKFVYEKRMRKTLMKLTTGHPRYSALK